MSKKTAIILSFFISFLFAVSCNLSAKSQGKNTLSFVLTNNPGKNEVGINLGCTYKATPAFTNPKDPDNKRLIDKDKPYNWNTITGVNRKKQNVIFDLKTPCRIDMVRILFDKPQKPKSVEILVSDSANGPWKSVGEMSKQKQTEKWWNLKLDNVNGRYVKLLHKLDNWGWYIREVKLYGNVLTASPGKAEITGSKLNIIENGKSFSTIVIANKPSIRVLDAAVAFQRIAHQMTGTWIPIILEANFNGKSFPVYIGDSQAVRKRGINVKQDVSDGDHYIIRCRKDYLAIVGNDAPEYKGRFLRSSVYGVYHLFEKLGCGWFGPDPLWQVIPEKQTLSIPFVNIDERPAFLYRHAWMHRMKSNELRDAWREGGIRRGRGHAYSRLVSPKKYKKAHPEWFGKGQPDITNPEVIKVVIAGLRKKIDEVPAPLVVPFSFSSNDTGGYVDSKYSKKVGNISAQQVYFANEVAKGLNKTHPGRFRLDCLAYWHSHTPPKPMIKVEPGVRIHIVNEGNHTKPLDMPESAEIAKSTSRNNTRELKAIAGWIKTGGLVGIYEWYIPAIGNIIWADMPWYPGELTLRNLRFWYSKGIRHVYYESQREKNGGFPLRWPVYYQCYRGMWNPELTAKEIMTEACEKLFGPAAQAMMNYYSVFEKAMLGTKELVGNWHLPSPEKVYTPEVERQADKWMKQAEKAVASSGSEKMKKRVAQEMKLWENAKSVLDKLRKDNKKTYKVTLNGKTMDYQKSKIDRRTIIALFGLSDKAKIEVIEHDGQNRILKSKEKINLSQKVVFKVVK